MFNFILTTSFDQELLERAEGLPEELDDWADNLFINSWGGCLRSFFCFNYLTEILSLQFNDDFILTIKNFIRGIVAQKVKLVRVWYVLGIQRWFQFLFKRFYFFIISPTFKVYCSNSFRGLLLKFYIWLISSGSISFSNLCGTINIIVTESSNFMATGEVIAIFLFLSLFPKIYPPKIENPLL